VIRRQPPRSVGIVPLDSVHDGFVRLQDGGDKCSPAPGVWSGPNETYRLRS